jgi:putative membrane protein
MIRGYSDHAANERTFLAWVRTGIAVIAFGFVIEKFNLFVLAIATADPAEAGRRLHLENLSGPFGQYGGLALVLIGLALIVAAAARFVRTQRLLDDQDIHPACKRSRGANFFRSAGPDGCRLRYLSRPCLKHREVHGSTLFESRAATKAQEVIGCHRVRIDRNIDPWGCAGSLSATPDALQHIAKNPDRPEPAGAQARGC